MAVTRAHLSRHDCRWNRGAYRGWGRQRGGLVVLGSYSPCFTVQKIPCSMHGPPKLLDRTTEALRGIVVTCRVEVELPVLEKRTSAGNARCCVA